MLVTRSNRITQDVLPPTLNLHNPVSDTGVDIVALNARDQKEGGGVKVGISNSFGFGGTNAALVFRKV